MDGEENWNEKEEEEEEGDVSFRSLSLPLFVCVCLGTIKKLLRAWPPVALMVSQAALAL